MQNKSKYYVEGPIQFMGKTYKHAEAMNYGDIYIPTEVFAERMIIFGQSSEDNYVDEDSVPIRHVLGYMGEFFGRIRTREILNLADITKIFWIYSECKHEKNSKLYHPNSKAIELYKMSNDSFKNNHIAMIERTIDKNPDISLHDLIRFENERFNKDLDDVILRREDGTFYVDHSWREKLTDEYIDSVIKKYKDFEAEFIKITK